MSAKEVIEEHYFTEGDFGTKEDFIKWLDDNNLLLPSSGWLNKIEFLREIKKVKLQFMVDPHFLKENSYVEDPVLVKVIEPEMIFLQGILGESGRKLVLAGANFIFERELAEKLINKGIAVKVLEVS